MNSSQMTKVKIGDLGKIITGNTPPKNDETNYGGKYPFIKPTDMTIDQRYVYDYEETYSEKAYNRYKNSYIPQGATGVVTIGTVGEKIFQAHEDCFTNQSVNCVISDGKKFDQDYIFYLLKFNLPKVEGANPGTASGRHHVSKSNFSSIQVDVFEDIKTQKKIAQILSNYDDLIDNNLKQIKLLEEKARLTYEEWFLRFRIDGVKLEIDRESGLPFGWERKKIEDVCTVSGGGTPSKENPLYWENGDIIWFSPTDLSKSNSLCLLDSQNKTNALGIKKSSAKILNSDSFMMTSRATIGLFGLVENEFSTNQGFINITPKRKEEKYYLLYNFIHRVEEFKGLATGATFPELSRGKFKPLPIVWSDKELIKKFHKIVTPIIDTVFNLQKQNQRLKEARDILLPRLMMGIIEV